MSKFPKIKIDRRNSGSCQKCHGNFPLTGLYSYVDEANHAINNNAYEYCKTCFISIYRK